MTVEKRETTNPPMTKTLGRPLARGFLVDGDPALSGVRRLFQLPHETRCAARSESRGVRLQNARSSSSWQESCCRRICRVSEAMAGPKRSPITLGADSRCSTATVVFVLPGSLDAVETAWDHPIRADLDSPPCNLVQRLPRLMEPENQSSPAKSS